MPQRSNAVDHRNATQAVRALALPAWLFSCIFHLLVLIGVGLAWQGAVQTSPPSEQDRSASIVLVQRNADQQTSYFADQQQQPAQDRLAAPNPSNAAAEETPHDLLLPPQGLETAPLIPDVALPLAPEGVIDSTSTDGLTSAPRLTIGRRPTILPGLDDAAILADDAARRPPPGPTGPVARISLFGSDAAPGRTFVFVVDRSHSMGSTGLGALSAVEGELAGELEKLLPEHRFQIIAYHQKPVYFDRQGLVAATDENRQAAGKFFKNLAAFGATEHEIALLAALRLQPDVIFLFTDGGDPYLSEGQIERITRRSAGRTAIHCIQFGYGPLQEQNGFMRQLARRNRGSYGYVEMSKWQRKGP